MFEKHIILINLNGTTNVFNYRCLKISVSHLLTRILSAYLPWYFKSYLHCFHRVMMSFNFYQNNNTTKPLRKLSIAYQKNILMNCLCLKPAFAFAFRFRVDCTCGGCMCRCARVYVYVGVYTCKCSVTQPDRKYCYLGMRLWNICSSLSFENRLELIKRHQSSAFRLSASIAINIPTGSSARFDHPALPHIPPPPHPSPLPLNTHTHTHTNTESASASQLMIPRRILSL